MSETELDIRARATELMDLGNRIDDKITEVEKLESEIEKLQVYRNERGMQLLTMLIDQRESKSKEESKEVKSD